MNREQIQSAPMLPQAMDLNRGNIVLGGEPALPDSPNMAGALGKLAAFNWESRKPMADYAPNWEKPEAVEDSTPTPRASELTYGTGDTGSVEDTAVTAMAEREQIKKQAPARTGEAEVEEVPATSEKGEELKAELDDLLDEIDEVLEQNAEEFVRSYVQKGGQ